MSSGLGEAMSALTQNTSTAKYAATDAPRSTCQRVCAPICVSLLGGPEGQVVPSEGFLHTPSLRRKVVSVKACPPTYTTMFVTVDSLGRPMDPPRPAGYVDPYILHLGRPQFDGPGHAYVYARQVQEHPARLSYAWWAEPDGASSAVPTPASGSNRSRPPTGDHIANGLQLRNRTP